MPGAPQPTVLDKVHSTCHRVVESQQSVMLMPDAIQAFAQQLDAAAVKAAAAKSMTPFPIKFDSKEAEITFLALYHLLDFGSGYDKLLRASSSKRGWKETIQYGCFGLALTVTRLDGPWMRAFSPYSLHTTFGIDARVDEELQPGITISKKGPLAPLADALLNAIVEAGNSLASVGSKSLGALILDIVEGHKQAGKSPSAAALVEELADTIPGFQDTSLFTPAAAAATAAPGAETTAATAAASTEASEAETAEATTAGGSSSSSSSFSVVYLRKAQALAAELEARFGREDSRFAWSDSAHLAADSGAVIPAVLHALGLLKFSDSLTSTLEQQQQRLPTGPSERALRAAAVAAVDAVVAAAAAATTGVGSSEAASPEAAAAAAKVTASELSSYLLSLVREEGQELLFQGAVLRPHFTTGTVAY